MISISNEPMAPPHYVFVCRACGKTSKGQWGAESMDGWDESCAINSVLAREIDVVRDVRGFVVEIKEQG